MLSLLLAFGVIVLLGSFLLVTPVMLIASEGDDVCTMPVYVALVITAGATLVLTVVLCLCKLLGPLLFFLEGFILGLLTFLVLTLMLNQSIGYEALADQTVLVLFLVIGVLCGVVCGVVAYCLRREINLVIRCAVGGYGLAVSVSSLMEACGAPSMPTLAFYATFGGSALAGAAWSYYKRDRKAQRNKLKKAGAKGEEGEGVTDGKGASAQDLRQEVNGLCCCCCCRRKAAARDEGGAEVEQWKAPGAAKDERSPLVTP